MTRLSVNINKIATLRNARGENVPDVQRFAADCERFGAQGITVHPRPDERHITRRDVELLAPAVTTEFNIEGYPDDRYMEIVLAAHPAQATLVPDSPSQLTSNAGWDVKGNREFLRGIVSRLKEAGIRVSIFVDADVEQVKAAAEVGADRVELYTKPYADNYAADRAKAVEPFVRASAAAAECGLGVNGGKRIVKNQYVVVLDERTRNGDALLLSAEKLPRLDEVSIGHAIVSDALYLGIEETIHRYLECLR